MDNQEDFFDDIISDQYEIHESDPDQEDEEEGPLDVRTVIMAKEEMLALLSIKTTSDESVIVRFDPRQQLPSAQTYDEAADAKRWFNRSLATSKRNGWEVIFDGAPNFG